MCSICGATKWNEHSEYIWHSSMDRGRDAHGKMGSPGFGWIGNHRAIPTTETETPIENQPVGIDPKIVFNGIISNDDELGILEGEADTSVLPRVLDFSSLLNFKKSIEQKLKGSFAIAVMFSSGEIWLACNYKPIWLAEDKDGEWYFSSLKNHFPKFLSPFKMDPYSVMNLKSGKKYPLFRFQSNRALVICSSGLDSTAVAAYAIHQHGKKKYHPDTF